MLEMHWLDSLEEKSVRVWHVLCHSLGSWVLGLFRSVQLALSSCPKSHNPKGEMPNIACALKGSMTLADFRGEVWSYSEQAADPCQESTLTYNPTFLQYHGGFCGNHEAIIGNDLTKLRIEDSYKFARFLSTHDAVKRTVSKLIFDLSELASQNDGRCYEFSFKSDATEDKIHYRYSELNHTTCRSIKYTGSWAGLHIAMYAKRMWLNCRGCRSNIRSVN